jgi:hypothetical protein
MKKPSLPLVDDPSILGIENILFNMEVNIVQVYKDHPELLDHHVRRVLEQLERTLKAQQAGRTPPESKLQGLEVTLHDKLLPLIENFIQGGDLVKMDGDAPDSVTDAPDSDGEPLGADDDIPPEILEAMSEPVSNDDMIRAVKRLLRSQKTWGSYGIRGYLDYVSGFFKG